jgi:hypothetical protein
MLTAMVVVGVLNAAFAGLSTALAGGTRSQVAKAEAQGFLIGAGIAGAIYLVVWAGTIAYVAAATGGATFSPQIYNAFKAGHAYAVRLDRATTLYRYTSYGPPSTPGMQSVGLSGQWWSTTLYPSASQAVQELALPPANTAQYVYSTVVPAGTQVLVGEAAPLFGQFGGAVQVYTSQPMPMAFLQMLF